MKRITILGVFLVLASMLCLGQEKEKQKLEIPVNQWVKIGEGPADPLGRDVPLARGSTWVYNSDDHLFYRYGGFTPRFSNALTTYDPNAKIWTELFADDENYPDTRPQAVTMPSMGYDSAHKKIWIAGGYRSVDTGKFGVWQYDIEKGTFSLFKEHSDKIRRMTFAFDRGIAVISPSFIGVSPRNAVEVLDLKTGELMVKKSEVTPNANYRGNFPIVYHQAAKKMVCVVNFKDTIETYVLDLETYQWEKLAIEGPQGENRLAYNIMYEPKSELVFLFGGHNGRDAEYDNYKRPYYNDTWVFDIKKKEWREVKIPGPANLKAKASNKDYDVLTFGNAYDYDAFNECVVFCDADRGVWALKYDPTQEISSAVKPNEGVWVGAKKAFLPLQFKTALKEGTKSNEILRTLPSGLNEKILSMPDNTVIGLGGKIIGAEIGWTYSPKHGVFFKYGGCGNNSAAIWDGYGNDLSYYDPVTEKLYSRRVSDVSGAMRPNTGCTRSIIWDSKREVFWFLGGAASGPFQPSALNFNHQNGNYHYDPTTDAMSFAPRIGQSVQTTGVNGTYFTYDAKGDVFVAPLANGETAEFICAEGRWAKYPNTNSPGLLSVYNRMAYVSSQKKMFMIYPMNTGETSTEKPAERSDIKEAAGKETKVWRQDEDKVYREKTLGTFMYDSTTHKWQKMETKTIPMYRESKYGLAYDPYNDVVILLGGNINWNGPVVNDMWAYDVKKNEWEKLNPDFGKNKVVLNGCLKTDFDTRHNAVIFATGSGTNIWAYRYKKGDWKPEK